VSSQADQSESHLSAAVDLNSGPKKLAKQTLQLGKHVADVSRGSGQLVPSAAWDDLHIARYLDVVTGVSTHTSFACAGAVLAIVLLVAMVAVLSDASLQGSGNDKEWRERSCLLDNAKFVCLVMVVFNNEVTLREQTALAAAVNMIGMPMLCFISGLSAKGSARRRDVSSYITYLVLPTLIWVFVVHPLIIVPMMYPKLIKDQLLDVITLQTLNLAARDLASNMAYIWYLFPALILWRGCTLLLANYCKPVIILMLSLIISCALGYVNLDDNMWKLPLNPVVGYLPYFAVGLVFPLEAACRSMYIRAEPAYAAFAAFLVALWVTVVVPTLFESLALPGAGEWYGAPPKGDALTAYDPHHWDYRLYWTRRLCKVAVDMVAVLIVMFLVLPRSKTCITRAGRYTLYPYLFQQLASRYLHLLIQLLGLQDLADQGTVSLAVTWLHLPWAVAVVVVFSSSVWRCIFSWALEPVWFERCVWFCLEPRMDEGALPSGQPIGNSAPVRGRTDAEGENEENLETGRPSTTRPGRPL